MTKLELFKKVVGFASGAGASYISASIVANNVLTDNAYRKVTVFCGSLAIGSVLSEVVSEHTDAKIDAVAAWWQENVSK